MDKNYDYSPFSSFGLNNDSMDDMYSNSMFNPVLQYEQGYMYYKFMCQQLEYKMKLKEYERQSKSERQ